MKNVQKRIDTILLLVRTSTAFSTPDVQSAVVDELQEIARSAKVMPLKRRRLLAVLHLARGLETSLRSVVDSNGIVLTHDKRNMGGYLNALVSNNPPLLNNTIKHTCIRDVTKVRNRIAHSAGGYPKDDQVVDAAAQAAYSCLSMLVR